MENDYPLANTRAARMLAEGLARAKDERGLSVRQIGKMMNYKTAVVLSHMSLGRVPIPIERAQEIAKILKLDKTSFLQEVLRQRHPEIDWNPIFGSGQQASSDGLAHEMEAVLGAPIKDLNRDQRAVMREVAAERSPRKRWLSVHELQAVAVLREIFPYMQTDGISRADLTRLRAAADEK